MGARVESRDHGAKALLEAFKGGTGQFVLKVGILEKGEESHGQLTVAEVATFHEFGTANVPERSFLRAWHDENADRIKLLIRAQLKRVTRGEITQRQAWEQLGSLFVGEIQKRIVARIPPPLADSTIRAKGSDVPLVDTGQLKASISYSVEEA